MNKRLAFILFLSFFPFSLLSAKESFKIAFSKLPLKTEVFRGSLKLNSGYEMPSLGLGTWTLTEKTCEDAVYAAVYKTMIRAVKDVKIRSISNPSHIAENFGVWDFKLTDSKMKILANLNTGKRYENW